MYSNNTSILCMYICIDMMCIIHDNIVYTMFVNIFKGEGFENIGHLLEPKNELYNILLR